MTIKYEAHMSQWTCTFAQHSPVLSLQVGQVVQNLRLDPTTMGQQILSWTVVGKCKQVAVLSGDVSVGRQCFIIGTTTTGRL